MVHNELWYNKLGFFNNPFSIKPAAFHTEIIGYDLDEIFSKIDAGSVMYVAGPMGVGKTTILKHIIAKFGGKGKVIYTSCNTSDKKISFRQLLIGGSFFSKLFSVASKNMVLLVDEAQDIKKQESSEILKLFKKGNFKSVVFFGTEYPEEKFVPELHGLAKDNVKQLEKLKPEHAVELIRKRVGSISAISDAQIVKVYRLSNSNPRRLLENLEDLLKYVVDSGAEKVSESHIKAVIKVEKQPKPKLEKATQQPDIVIEEVHDVELPITLEHIKPHKKKIDNYGVRTYEEEMETIKQEVDK